MLDFEVSYRTLAYFDMLGSVCQEGHPAPVKKIIRSTAPQMSGNTLIGGNRPTRASMEKRRETCDVKHPRWNLATAG